MSTAVEQIAKPYHQTDRFSLYEGDCRFVLPSFADCSIDAVVTDPPYELGFMGKGWDRSGIAYDVSVWRECLRVLKPGGHLLAFGGSRTYHRLACAIEDAGFEIRDQIQWIYAQGFPKSLDVSKNLREEGFVCTCNGNSKALPQHGLRSLSDADLSPTLDAEDQSGQVLQSRLSEQGASKPWATWAESEITGPQQPGMEGRRDGVQEERQLHRSALRESAAMGAANGSQGRLHHGASVDYGPDVWVPADENGSSQPLESQTPDQRRDESGTVAHERGSQTRGGWSLCPRCCKPILPEGIGSALKPAHEPIVLARKPLTSTLIQNVLQHGTGGLNIDGCRIELSANEDVEELNARSGGKRGFASQYVGGNDHPLPAGCDLSKGRWPANIIHDGSEEVLAGFPETETNAGTAASNHRAGMFGIETQAGRNLSNGDSGSAARFFYCAKASQEDRNEGLEDLPIQSAGAVTDRKDGSAGLNSPRAGAGRTNGSRNPHPTVKPTDLMRYLCRLVTPPGGIVLDPFCGSGSTGKAAMLEGFKFVGIELNEDYCQLAQRRIEAVTRQGLLFG